MPVRVSNPQVKKTKKKKKKKKRKRKREKEKKKEKERKRMKKKEKERGDFEKKEYKGKECPPHCFFFPSECWWW